MTEQASNQERSMTRSIFLERWFRDILHQGPASEAWRQGREASVVIFEARERMTRGAAVGREGRKDRR